MKLTKVETAFLAVGAAAIFFTAGYFAGRGGPRELAVTVERPVLKLPESSAGESGKIDINTATVSELKTLTGIGEVLAERIVEYREENGPFLCPEDIMNVPGIGESAFDALAGEITCGFDVGE